MSKKHHRKLDHFEDHSVDPRDMAAGPSSKKIKKIRLARNAKEELHGHYAEMHNFVPASSKKRGPRF